MQTASQLLSGWNRYPTVSCTIARPERYKDLRAQSSVIIRGQGRSYGDAALNAQGTVILTQCLNRILSFDKKNGTLQAEAGITLAELLAVIIPHGWFLPVAPGTKYVTLGGCIAADVHGKNHHHVGSFANSLLSFDLILADNTQMICSPTENQEAFWATVGGMGLTGIIGTATLKLMPITNTQMTVRHSSAQHLEHTFALLNDPAYDDDYTVAWLDSMASGQRLGRAIIMAAHHARPTELTSKNALLCVAPAKKITVPFNCPSWLLNNFSIKLFNNFYCQQRARINHNTVSYNAYFYPLDSIANWNKLYGKNGFIQYQCVIPEKHGFIGIKTLLEKLATAKCLSFLGVLKRLGAQNQNYLSFPLAGYTLALDIPIKNQKIFALLDKLDAIVVNYGGRVYLAKDARLKPDMFRAMYPHYPLWLQQKQRLDPNHYFTSQLAQRLKIGY